MRHLLGALLLVSSLCIGAASSPEAQERPTLDPSLNRGTVGIITGGVNGTYIRVAADLAAVLDQGDDLRILPILGKGSVQNIADILYLRGVDIGIVQSDVLEYFRREIWGNVGRRVHYISKLYNEEFHVLASEEIGAIDDLAGKQVNFDTPGSGTHMTASLVFGTLGVPVEPVTFDQSLALEKLKTGEIAAMVYVAGKPTQLFDGLSEESGLHFLEVPYTPDLLQTYLPSRLSHEDYPGLVAEDEQVRTIAVGAVLAVYNWDPGTERYDKVSRFIEAFFSRFGEFQQPPRHPKWHEVNLAAEVPGWTRFPPAQEWLDRQAVASEAGAATRTERSFQAFLEEEAPAVLGRNLTEDEREELFERFLAWQREQRF
jgi:uncharacterized protein